MSSSTQLQRTPLAHLTQTLVEEFERDPRGKGVASLLADYSVSHEDWRDVALFAPDHYTRNLVFRNEDFELLLLCWNAGQVSPIHNHMGQNCWMTVLDGVIEEVQYRPTCAAGAGPLERGNSRLFRPGSVAYITDDVALHLVRPTQSQPGVSLHLYSKPIDSCHVYDEATSEVVMRSMGYYSVQGKRVEA